MTPTPHIEGEDEGDLEGLGSWSYRKQHVLFVLVDSPGIRNRVSMFDDGHRLP